MENENQNVLSSIDAVDIMSSIDGIPLPKTVKRSLWKALSDLVVSAADVPIAKLESIAQHIRNESNGLGLVTKTASEVAANEFSNDKELIDRAVNYFGSKLLKAQINREKVAYGTIHELRNNPPSEDSKKEIDIDWLDTFSRIAETKSNEDVQLFLSKILAGEITNPGTFSAKTIHTLSTLDTETAEIFQSFCNVSFSFVGLENNLSFVLTTPFGPPGNNSLKEYNLSYLNLTLLQDAGLIKNDLASWRDLPKDIFNMPIIVGNTVYVFKPNDKTPDNIRVEGINFTKVGMELKRVMHIVNIDDYNAKVEQWIALSLATPKNSPD